MGKIKCACIVVLLITSLGASNSSGIIPENEFDIVIVGGTPSGIMSAISAARLGKTSVILERTRHIGGLPANGLGATDIATRGATGGLFLEFVNRVKNYYIKTYGEKSLQVKMCSDGYHFEPSVAERVFIEMLGEHPQIKVFFLRQFDADPANVVVAQNKIIKIKIFNRETRKYEYFKGRVFIDATYEGDLAAAAGVPYRLGREGKSEFNEPMAGRLYKHWGGDVGEGSTGLADNAVQAYNFRLCLTTNETNKVKIPKPVDYRREDYISLIDDIKNNRHTGAPGSIRREFEWDGIGRIVNIVQLPNGKTDANNQHASFVSTDLPEENWPWPTSSWEWRDKFAERLKNYTLGLLWFCQNDPELPDEFKEKCGKWGLAKDEYTDNENFPRQVYVREGRRIEGEYLFTAHDSLPMKPGGRPPIHATSITASHYPLDSHAVRKREPGRVHLDGFFSYPTSPYTVPYGVIVPKKVENLLTPTPVSGTHIGFSTLRMEPCWMALGQAAGVAAAISIDLNLPVRKVPIDTLQKTLLKEGAILIYYRDLTPQHPYFIPAQWFGVRGLLTEWNANLDKILTKEEMNEIYKKSGIKKKPKLPSNNLTKGELLDLLYRLSKEKSYKKAFNKFSEMFSH